MIQSQHQASASAHEEYEGIMLQFALSFGFGSIQSNWRDLVCVQ